MRKNCVPRLGAVLALALVSACAEPQDPGAVRAAPGPASRSGVAAPWLAHEEYAALHHAALRPQDEGWEEALEALSERGNGFTLIHLQQLDRSALEGDSSTVLEGTLVAIESRLGEAGDDQFAGRIQVLLERAAWTDLMCDSLETSLPRWSKETVAARLTRPGVRDEVERIESTYSAAREERMGLASMSERVRDYAAAILAMAGDR